MKKKYYQFLSQFLAGIQSEKQFFIAKKTKAACQLSAVFQELGIIDFVTIPRDEMVPNSIKKYKDQYLAYWFKKQEKHMNNRVFLKRHRFSRNTYPFHKIKIIGKPSTYHKNKISYKEMIKYYPYWNTIYIMHTSRGVITSKEAFEYQIGGFIMCKIIL